jgi:hypothetical protein
MVKLILNVFLEDRDFKGFWMKIKVTLNPPKNKLECGGIGDHQINFL